MDLENKIKAVFDSNHKEIWFRYYDKISDKDVQIEINRNMNDVNIYSVLNDRHYIIFRFKKDNIHEIVKEIKKKRIIYVLIVH
jgi:hypothetical protein